MKGLICKVIIGHELAGRALGGKERLDEWGNGRILVLRSQVRIWGGTNEATLWCGERGVALVAIGMGGFCLVHIWLFAPMLRTTARARAAGDANNTSQTSFGVSSAQGADGAADAEPSDGGVLIGGGRVAGKRVSLLEPTHPWWWTRRRQARKLTRTNPSNRTYSPKCADAG
eukprot:4621681-Prymnesium_polylepis.1